METAIVMVALIGFVAFRQWLAHQRRIYIHRERLLAIEKGVELPPLEQEVRRSNLNVQRILLLAGLIWIAVGIGIYVTLTAIVNGPDRMGTPQGIQYAGFAFIGIGIAHLAALLVGGKKAS